MRIRTANNRRRAHLWRGSGGEFFLSRRIDWDALFGSAAAAPLRIPITDPVKRAIAYIRGEGWTVTPIGAEVPRWRVAQRGDRREMDRAELLDFAGVEERDPPTSGETAGNKEEGQ